MYQLITKDTNFKKMRLYYSEYQEEYAYYFRPVIRTVYVRTVRYYTYGLMELVGEGIVIRIHPCDIPEGGTFSIQIGDNKIVSTSKQDIARFWKRKLFSNFPLSHFAYNNNDFISRQSKYKQCLAMLKKLL
jgi:hypothetical protein